MTSAYESGTIPPIELKHRLRIAREYAGMEQGDLAEAMGVTRSTISNAETGKGHPQRTTINLWALACGVPASWLKTGDQGPDDGGGGGGANVRSWDYKRQAGAA